MGYADRLRRLQPENSDFGKLLADIYRLCQRWDEAADAYYLLLADPAERRSALLASLGEALVGLHSPEAEALFDEAESRALSWQEELFLLSTYQRCELQARLIASANRLLASPALSPSLRRHAQRRLQGVS